MAKPRRQGLTRHGAAPLLHIVGGRSHAVDAEPADPADPDPDGLILPPVAAPKTTTTAPDDHLRPPPTRKRKADPPQPDPEPELRKPGAGKKQRGTAPIVPRHGQFEHSQAAKAAEWNKENAASGNIWVQRFGLFSSQSSQHKPKKTYATHTKTNKTFAAHTKTKTRHVDMDPSDSDSSVSMVDNDEPDRVAAEAAAEEKKNKAMAELGLRSVPTKKKQKQPAMDNSKIDHSKIDHPDIDHPDIDHIDAYVHNLPTAPEQDTACPLCNEPVSHDMYCTFWKSLPKTVKNQTAFCHAHKLHTATKQYLAAGYPSRNNHPHIDWAALPARIKTHQPPLSAILANTTPSTHRARYTPLALTGKAAALPSERPDLPAHTRAHLAAYTLDSPAVCPGYYGPRGRRLMTEALMALFAPDLKKSTDKVVLTSGPASFVQAVLVPELANRLIMEDLRCGVDAADEIREMTFDMGALLFEEVEDWVHVDDDDEEEEE